MTSTTLNKPREERLARRLPFQFRDGDAQARWHVAETSDLSSSGLSMLTARAVPPLSRLEIRFPGWPSEQPSIQATVRWSRPGRPGRMGVRFQTANPAYIKLMSSHGRIRVAPGVLVPSFDAPKDTGDEVLSGWKPRLTRHVCCLPVQFGAGGAGAHAGEIFDIAAQGLGLQSARMLAAGTDVWISIQRHLDQEAKDWTARAEGTVIWVQPGSPKTKGRARHGVRVDCADSHFYDLFIHRLRVAANRWRESSATSPSPA